MIPKCHCCQEHLVRFPNVQWCPICDQGARSELDLDWIVNGAIRHPSRPYDWEIDGD